MTDAILGILTECWEILPESSLYMLFGFLAAIAGCSLLLGWLLNRFYAWTGLDIIRWVTHFQHEKASLPAVSAALVLVGLIVWQNPRGWWEKQGGCCG